jgi:hypothetical protein
MLPMQLADFIHFVKRELESEKLKTLYVGFSNFPLGSCMDASILLGNLLIENGYGDFYLVSGERSPFLTHSWLESSDWIIDITADQFDDTLEVKLMFSKTDHTGLYKDFIVTSAKPVIKKSLVADMGYIAVYNSIKVKLRQ